MKDVFGFFGNLLNYSYLIALFMSTLILFLFFWRKGVLSMDEEAKYKMMDENPELALMGSCVLGMLMKGEDVYLMNVGDSRAVLAQNKETDIRIGKVDQDLERINEESMFDFEVPDGVKPSLTTLQLTVDHSTCDEEVVACISICFLLF